MENRIPETAIYLLIFTLCVIIYGQTGSYEYILYDDIIVLNDPGITGGLSIKNIVSAFIKPPDHVPYQSPIPVLARMAQWEIVGDNFGWQHLFSLFTHIATVMLLFLFLRSATGHIWGSGFAALLVAVHPLNVEPVCWLAGLNGLLENFFLMLTLICYLFYTRAPAPGRYVLTLFCFLLGLMCKPTIVAAPLLLLLIDYWPLRRIDFSRSSIRKHHFPFKRAALEKTPFILLAILYLSVARLLTGGDFTPPDHGGVTLYPGAVIDFIFHMGKIIYPVGLTICRPPPPEAPMWMAITVLTVPTIASCLILWKADNHRYIITGWMWLLITSLPALIMVFLSGRPVEDRHFYTPLMGLFIAFAFGLCHMAPGKKSNRLATALALLIICLLVPVSYLQVKHWKNSITVFGHAISLFPENARTRTNLGDALMEKGDITAAIYHYRELIQIAPDSAPAHTKLANVLTRHNMPEEAHHHYKRAITLAPDYIFAYHGFANFLMERGETEQAIAYYQHALEIEPSSFQTHNNLATALLQQGKIQEAVFHLQTAIRINPEYQTAIKNLNSITERSRTTDSPEHFLSTPGND